MDLDLDAKLNADEIATVAVAGEGVDRLIKQVGEVLGERLPEADAPVPVNDRQAECLARIAFSETVEQRRDAVGELIG